MAGTELRFRTAGKVSTKWARVLLPCSKLSGPPATKGAEGVQMEGRARNLPLSAPLQEWATPAGCEMARSIENSGGRKTGLGVAGAAKG